MAEKCAKIYISMPCAFLKQLDQLAKGEHQSRSAIIREAVKLYMEWRSTPPAARFFNMTEALRESFERVPEEELESRIDRAVTRVRRNG